MTPTEDIDLSAIYAEDDDGYYGYVETSHDPGYSLLFATILFCIISYCSLPCLVAMGNRLDVKNQQEILQQQQQQQQARHRRNKRQKHTKVSQDSHHQQQLNDEEDDEQVFYEAAEEDATVDVDPIFEVTDGPPSPHRPCNTNTISNANANPTTTRTIMRAPHPPPSPDRSYASARSTISIGATSVSSISSFHTHRTRKRRNRNIRAMMKRHGLEEYELRMLNYDSFLYDTSTSNNTVAASINTTHKTPTNTNTTTRDNGQFTPQRHSKRQQQQQKNRDVSPERSVMGPLDPDAVSMDDAASMVAGRSPRRFNHNHHPNLLQSTGKPGTKNRDKDDAVIFTKGGLQQPDYSNNNNNDGGGSSGTLRNLLLYNSFFDTLLDLVTWDFESKRIIKLAIPFATQALSTGILDSICVAVIGKVLGTREVSAFVIVRTLIDISSSFFGGFHESIATLGAQALGRHNNKLVGQYVQLSMFFYVVCYIPFVLIWWAYMPALLAWLGFDAETITIGHGYTKVYLFLELIDGVDESIHALLDVIDLESYSTLVGVSQELVTFLDILLVTLIAKPSLMVIGFIELFVALIFISINLGYIVFRGWFQPYREGLIGSWALHNKQAAKLMLSTASSLSFGYLLTNGEWEILTLFASFLGPAEVAAWGILGVLWEAIERLTEAVADASEVRCAFLLGSGQPDKAKRSAHKSILLGVFLSLFLTSFVFMAGENLATWFTNDPALQHIIADLIPLFGIGNVTLTMGTICWTLLGSQGRYQLATGVACIASWCITLPLAALFTFQLKINLQGQTAAIVIGYMASGTINAYFLLRSDWNALSQTVMQANEEEEMASPDLILESVVGDKLRKNEYLDDQDILSNPTLGTLGTLMEARSGEESFTSSSSAGILTPDFSPDKEIV